MSRTAHSVNLAVTVDAPGWTTTAPDPHYWLAKNWKRYIILSDSQDLWEFGNEEAPRVSGVYFLWSGDLRLLYIGQSGDVLHRMNQHAWGRKIRFRYFSMIEMDMDIAPIIELAYICALQPPHNNLFGPVRWDGHNRMARLIKRLWRCAKD